MLDLHMFGFFFLQVLEGRTQLEAFLEPSHAIYVI